MSVLKSLHIYPVKSCKGLALDHSTASRRGLKGDRRMMIVDETGGFLSQRSHPQMSGIAPSHTETGFALTISGHTVYPEFSGNRMTVRVWRDDVSALIADEATNQVLSEALSTTVRLVKMDESSRRQTNPDWAKSDVSFADGYPVLVTNTASLDALSREAGMSIPMNRFRPNIVIDTTVAWAEDQWKFLKIGNTIIELVKPCTRCLMTNIDQDTGRTPNRTVLKTLGRVRQSTDPKVPGVLFGWNGVIRQTGTLQTGAQVLIETR